MGFLFQLEQVSGLDFDIEVKKPPRNDEWQCSITFNGKNSNADFNADMCLFLEQWEELRDEFRTYKIPKDSYYDWQDRTLAYYVSTSVECVEPEALNEYERIVKRREFLENLCKKVKGDARSDIEKRRIFMSVTKDKKRKSGCPKSV